MSHGVAYYWAGKVQAVQFFAAAPFGMNVQQMNAWLYSGEGYISFIFATRWGCPKSRINQPFIMLSEVEAYCFSESYLTLRLRSG